MPRKISRCPGDLMEIIHKVADVFDMRDVNYHVLCASEDEDSFYGSLFKVNFIGNRNGHKIEKSVVIKWHLNPEQRESVRELYYREYNFYRYIVPMMLEIQSVNRIIEGLKIKFQNCVYQNREFNRETTVLMGLQYDNFVLHNRSLKLEMNHASLVMKYLAKLHALSFVAERAKPKEFEDIKKIYDNDVQYSKLNQVPESMRHYYDASVSVVADPVLKEKLQALAPHLLTVLNSCVTPASYSAICHGDCWTNNFSFKYQGTRPVEVIFFDYQLSRLASPITDISYFLYMSIERDVLFENQENLLNIYYGTLTGVLRHCNLNVKDVYPRDIFEQHLRDYSVLGLIESLVSMKIITADIEDAFKMKYQQPEKYIDDFEIHNKDSFVDRVNTVVNSFFLCGYSLDAILNKSLID